MHQLADRQHKAHTHMQVIFAAPLLHVAIKIVRAIVGPRQGSVVGQG